TYAALVLTVVGLTLLIGGGLVGIWAGVAVGWIKVAGAALTGLGLAFYLADIIEFYRTRRRKILELNSLTAAAALVLITLSLALGALAMAFGVLDRYAGTIGYLFLFGGLTGLGLSQLYKIVPFLTWLDVFGPKLGKGPIPLVQDLVNEPRATPGFILFFVNVVVATGALATGQTLIWKITTVLQLIATILIVIELWRSRHPALDIKPGVSKPVWMPSSAAKPPVVPSVAKKPTPPSSSSHPIQGE
ncbi:MAG TPA: hypothetical protein VHK70_04760, partial [Burkholderiaceae bacterium]|nr:hypothetical protein [Burkholderiaceae bacterium]